MRAYWIIGIAIAALLAGCHWAMKPAQTQAQPITDATSGVAGIVAHTESADRHVHNAAPHSSSEGKMLLKAASDEHKEVLADASEVKTALSEATGQVTSLEQRITNEQERYAHLEGRWYVTWGRRIERALWVIGIGWLVCGIASVVFGMGNPMNPGHEISVRFPCATGDASVRPYPSRSLAPVSFSNFVWISTGSGPAPERQNLTLFRS